MSVISIIIAIVILSVLVIAHEFGHYLLARMNGVLVKEFSIGFGPRIVSFGKGETKFSLKAIPFGGSCIMLGAMEDDEADDDEDEEDNEDKSAAGGSDSGNMYATDRQDLELDASGRKKSGGIFAGRKSVAVDRPKYDEERSFDKKSVWARMSIILAGPIFNLLVAFILAIVYVSVLGYDPATVTYVGEGTAAYEAGLREGDVITNINGTSIDFGREISLEFMLHPADDEDDVVNITYIRDGVTYKTTMSPKEYTSYSIGISYYGNEDAAKLAEVSEGTPAYEAGLREDDIITGINGISISSGEELEKYFSEHPVTGDAMEISYTHRGGEFTCTLQPVAYTGYKLGFSYNRSNVKTDVGGVLKYSLAEMKYEIMSVLKSLLYLVSGQGSLDMLSGPVGIVEVIGTTYDAASSSGFVITLMSMFEIMMLISTNFGVLNLFPIPAMDGGKFLLLVVEAIRGKPIKRKHEGIITVIGAALLVILMIVVLINDITKLFR